MENNTQLTTSNEDTIISLFKSSLEAFEQIGDVPNTEEVLLIFELFRSSLEARVISDLIALHHDFLKLKDVDPPVFPDEVKTLLQLSQVLDLLIRSEKVDFSQRLSYYAQMVNVLDEVTESAKGLRLLIIEKDAISSYIVPRWKTILLDKIKLLQGLPALEMKVDDIEAAQEYIEVDILLKNVGIGVAENITISSAMDRDIGLSPAIQSIGGLMPGRETRLTFHVPAGKLPENTRLVLLVTYDDLGGKGRSISFADVIHWQGSQKEFIPIPVNPYNFGLPVEKNLFYGRSALLESIIKGLETPLEKSAILIQGERRIGKTSLLFRLKEQLQQPFIPVYVNIQEIAEPGLSGFFEVFAFSILEALNENGVKVEEPSLSDLRASPTVYFKHKFLNPIFPRLDGRKIILLIDEFNALETKVRTGQIEKSVFEYIRHLMMESKLSFVIAGTPDMETIVASYWSVMFNTFKRVPIPLFTTQEANELVTSPVKPYITYDPLALERIYRATSGHPYYIQLLCHGLVEQGRKSETSYFSAHHIDQQIIRLVTGEGDYFKHNWSDISRESKILLIYLSQFTASGDPATLAEIKTMLQKRGLQINLEEVVRELTERGVVIADNGKLSFRIELVGLWINKTKSLDGLID